MPDPLAPLEICFFGPFEVRVNGAPLPRLRAHRGDALFALLTLRHDREVERAWVAGTLWPDASTPQGLATMRRYLTDLRRALGSEAWRLGSPTSHSLILDLTGAACDVVAFDAAIALGDHASLEQAVTLYAGRLLEQWTEEWVFEERQAREQQYLEALECLAADAIRRGEPGSAERHLRRAVVVDPLRESAQRALMQVLTTMGSYSAATQLYRELRLLMNRELNAEPADETRALYDALRTEARSRAQMPAAAVGIEGLNPARRDPERGTSPPAGDTTVTFLFTDIENGTRLWERWPEEMRVALARHDRLLRAAIERHEGHVFKTMGGQFCAAFDASADAVAAALAAQRALRDLELGILDFGWSGGCPRSRRIKDEPAVASDANPKSPIQKPKLEVRIALHTGVAEERNGDYFGPTLNRIARLLEAGHGGQTLLSLVTQELARDLLSEGTGLRDLGEHRLKDLERPERIFQLLAEDLPADFPPLRTLSTHPNNLPQALTSFIGREKEIAAVKQQLAEARLLTLTGVGGTGKSRLSLQVVSEVMAEYPDGVWLVKLAPLADPALVPQAVATVLSVLEEPGLPLTQTIVRHLKAKHLLLILDNCEHLLPACAQLADTILPQCPQVTILATSREGLAIPGESLYRVPSLSLPVAEGVGCPGTRTPDPLLRYEAVQLFADRAAAVRPGFAVSPGNAPAVAEICRQLDGIPLAIELAAAWVRALPVEQIVPQLSDRFRLLTGGSRTALPRQQTLRGMIDWSYDLLSDPERKLLRRLSVFAGGWTLEAAEVVCADSVGSRQPAVSSKDSLSPPLPSAGCLLPTESVLDLLTALVDKSLVQYEERQGEARYRLLETIRQYARERLLEAGELQAVRDRHAEFYLAWAEAAEPELRGGEQPAWLERLEVEHDNLRAALEWSQAQEHGIETQLRLVATLSWFWMMRSHFQEGRKWLEGALARGSDAPSSLRARALVGAAQLAAFGENNELAERLAEECLPLARESGEDWVVAWALYLLGWGVVERRDFARATVLGEESLAVARAVGDRWLIGLPLLLLGLVANFQGKYEASAPLFRESLALLREVGDRWASTFSLLSLGATAAKMVERLLDREQSHPQGDYEQATRYWHEALALYCEMADQRGIAWCIHMLAWAAAVQGRAERAAQLLGAAEALRETSGGSIPPYMQAMTECTQVEARAALTEAAHAAAWAAGRAMTLEEAICCALAEAGPDA